MTDDLIYAKTDGSKNNLDHLITNSVDEILFPAFTIQNHRGGFNVFSKIQITSANYPNVKVYQKYEHSHLPGTFPSRLHDLLYFPKFLPIILFLCPSILNILIIFFAVFSQLKYDALFSPRFIHR